MQQKLAETESHVNQVRRLLQAVTEEKKSLETKLEVASQERER